MAQEKARPGLVLYREDAETLIELPAETQTLILRAAVRYAWHDENPDFAPGSVAWVLWRSMQPKIERDGAAYESKRQRSRFAGLSSRWEAQTQGRIPCPFEDASDWIANGAPELSLWESFARQEPSYEDQREVWKAKAFGG